MHSLNPFPKVSIILPTYNRAGLIMETIDSILRQSWQNWELIIIDDGSDDNTEEIISRLHDARIKFHKAGRIGIGGKIKNIGLESVSGELIAFIDSDDLWAPQKIEKQVKALQQYPVAGFCLTGGYNFIKPGEALDYFYKQREGLKYDNVFISYFNSELPGFTQALMLRKECIDRAGRFKEEKSFSDIDFIISLAYHFKAVILYEPLVCRRLHDKNYIHPQWEKSYREGIEIIEEYKAKNMLPAKTARDAFFRLYINFGEECLLNNKKAKAINNFFKAWKYKIYSITPIKKAAKAVLRYFTDIQTKTLQSFFY